MEMLAQFSPQIDSLTQLTTGGLIIVLVLKMVFDYQLKNNPRVNGNGSGSPQLSGLQPTAFWQMEFRKAVGESLNLAIVPILEQQTKILEELKDIQQALREEMRDSQASIRDAQRENTAALREVAIENRARGRATGI